jgi:purine nucleosidase
VSDATNEIDDVYAIALALLYPERLKIEGFVGSNYDHDFEFIGPVSIERSVNEIHKILKKAGVAGKYPVYPGSHPMQYQFFPGESPGVDFIIERAMASTPDDPLWIVGLGSSTDLASAFLKEPAIKDRVIMFWHARTENTWPHRAINYNIKGDMHAARIMFNSPLPLLLFDTGTHLVAGPLEENEKYVKPYGELGQYLHDYRLNSRYALNENKAYFDMGDIAVLIDPTIGKWEEIDAPTVNVYMDYRFNPPNGRLLRCYDVDRDRTFGLLYDGLKKKFGLRREAE